MKRIGIISDTHIPKTAQELPDAVTKAFASVDMILHAGDLVEKAVIAELEKMAPTHAVYGNMDIDEVKSSLPPKDIIEVGGFRIGLIHGYGAPSKLVESVSREFTKVDAIVFGHSHSAFNKKIKGVLLFNPGSPTDKIFTPYNTYGILEVGDGIEGRIIRI